LHFKTIMFITYCMALDFFNSDDSDFLMRVGRELPGLIDNFEMASKIPSSLRWTWARHELVNVYRDGWFVNTPVGVNGDAESVDEHVSDLENFVKKYFPNDEQEDGLAYSGSHDNQEAITNVTLSGIKRDLNPRFNKESYAITDDDKVRIERLGVNLLLEGNQPEKDIWNDYSVSDSSAARNFRSTDKLIVMWKCVEYVESGKYQYPDFQKYWDYWPLEKAKEKLTPLVAEIYADDLMPKIRKLQCL